MQIKIGISLLTLCLITLGIGCLVVSIYKASSLPAPAQPVEEYKPHSPPAVSTPQSPMAMRLGSPDTTALEDLQTLHTIFGYSSLEASSQMPIGTNQEITRQLTRPRNGGSPYIAPDHPAINADGELTDRWQSPYFFHALSSEKMEVRSAGADRTFYTNDDLVWPRAEPTPQRPEIFERAVTLF